ncbi:hypothetical protein FSP39_016121 [Pinctada imbricata]|uniref:Uncharacterized protein n=1 Tax=Pinctada imbricata TaxID=66713 RepID=A0AA89BPW7_PINIB|nr:hypothetical protein FSP39_016121 [Pinctada imbricata]
MSAAISTRPSHRPYRPRPSQTQEHEDKFYPGGPKLYRQMVAGFTLTALFGMAVLSLGAAFLKDAIDSEYSISVMLCIMGIVIYTPSQDQLAFPVPTEQPPPYEAIMMNNLPPGGHPHHHGETTRTVEATIALPPKYSDVAAPPPKYSD